MQVEPSTRFANRALDSGERFLRRRPLYPAELRDQMTGKPSIYKGLRVQRSLLLDAFIQHFGAGCWMIFAKYAPSRSSVGIATFPNLANAVFDIVGYRTLHAHW